MSHPLNLTIDLLLHRMEENGEFDHLPGAGKPLDHLSDPVTTVLDRLLAEAGAKPVPVVLNAEIAAIRARLAETTDAGARKAVMRELADKLTRYAMEIEAYNRYG